MIQTSEPATSTDHIAALLVNVGSDSAVARNRAHRVPISMQAAAVKPLVGALRTSTEYSRGQAAKALGKMDESRIWFADQ